MDSTTLKKPKIGEPCNGCGLCCRLTVCHTGAYMMNLVDYWGEYRVYGQCPALTPRADGSFACGLLINPKKWVKSKNYKAEVISKHVAICISSGTGCDEIGTNDMITPEEDSKLTKIINDLTQNHEWVKKITNSVNILQKIHNDAT